MTLEHNKDKEGHWAKVSFNDTYKICNSLVYHCFDH